MSSVGDIGDVVSHVWSEPRSAARMQWFVDQPSPFQQILEQVGRSAVEQFAATGQWPDPDAKVSVVLPVREPEPDWGWWEPRYDQPGRRIAARDAAFARSRKGV